MSYKPKGMEMSTGILKKTTKTLMCLVSGSLGLCGTAKEHYFGF